MSLLAQKLMKQLRSETQEVLSVSNSNFLYSLTDRFLSFFNFSLCSFPPLYCSFSLCCFFPLWVSTPHCSSLANYQQCRLFLLFLFLAASLSQPGLSRYPWIFIFNCFLLFCLSAHHCLCLFQPPPVGKSLSLFSVLTNHCPWNHFFLI